MLKWLKQIALGVLALAVLAVAGGAAYEAIARASAARTFPAPGRMVDVGGRRLQLDCRGAGAPVVVFESGLDSLGSLAWSAVQDEVAKTTRACAYSRAGVMWSDPAQGPFSSARVADDLHKALAAAGEPPPYVMVGHSLGGPYLLTFTRRHGNEVAGLIFVDASHPDQLARLHAAIGRDVDQGEALAKTADALAWTGVLRLAAPKETVLPAHSPAAMAGPALALFPASLHATVGEMKGLGPTLAAAGQARRLGAHPLGDRPLVVLTHGEPFPPQALKQLKITPAEGARLDAEWLAMQNDEATWSTRSRHTVVAGASHYIQFDKPQVVIAAVRDVVGQVRAAKPAPAL
ncbi:MAG TPA: alpha/beta hydrolase [Caulobacteraceae bacterium]|nr:alpha/beta hydrolase [Caulobacteraceae bacterium]